MNVMMAQQESSGNPLPSTSSSLCNDGLGVCLLSTHGTPHAIRPHASVVAVTTRLAEQCVGRYRDALLLFHSCDTDATLLARRSLREQRAIRDGRRLGEHLLTPLALFRHRQQWLLLHAEVQLCLADRMRHFRLVVRRAPTATAARQLWTDLWETLGAAWRQRRRLLGPFANPPPPCRMRGDTAELPRDTYHQQQKQQGDGYDSHDHNPHAHLQREGGGDGERMRIGKDAKEKEGNGKSRVAFGPLTPARIGITTSRRYAIRLPILSMLRQLRVSVHVDAEETTPFFDATTLEMEDCRVPYVSPQCYIALRRGVVQPNGITHTFADDAWNVAVLTLAMMLADFELGNGCCCHASGNRSLSIFDDLAACLVREHHLPIVAAHNFIYATIQSLVALLLRDETESATRAVAHTTGGDNNDDDDNNNGMTNGNHRLTPQQLAEEWFTYLQRVFPGEDALLRDMAAHGLCSSSKVRWAAFLAAHASTTSEDNEREGNPNSQESPVLGQLLSPLLPSVPPAVAPAVLGEEMLLGLATQLERWRSGVARRAVLDGGCQRSSAARRAAIFAAALTVARRAIGSTAASPLLQAIVERDGLCSMGAPTVFSIPLVFLPRHAAAVALRPAANDAPVALDTIAGGVRPAAKASATARDALRHIDCCVSAQMERVGPLRQQLLQCYPKEGEKISDACTVPGTLRGALWGALLGVPPAMEREATYAALNTAAPTGCDRQLAVDIPRCHPYHPLIASAEGSERLRRVIKAWLCMNPGMTYWQGMDSVCAVLLAASYTDEPLVAAQLNALTKQFIPHEGASISANADANNNNINNSRNIIFTTAPSASPSTTTRVTMRMEDHLYQLAVLLRYCDPHLATHLLDDVSCRPELFAISWFLTLLAHGMSVQRVFLVWDFLFHHGANRSDCLTALCLSLLVQQRDRLLGHEFAVCLSTLTRVQSVDVPRLLHDAAAVLRMVPIAPFGKTRDGAMSAEHGSGFARMEVATLRRAFDHATGMSSMCTNAMSKEKEAAVVDWVRDGVFLIDLRPVRAVRGSATSSAEWQTQQQAEEHVIGALHFPLEWREESETGRHPTRRIGQVTTELLQVLENPSLAAIAPSQSAEEKGAMRFLSGAPHVVLFAAGAGQRETAMAELLMQELVRCGTPHTSLLLGGFVQLRREVSSLIVRVEVDGTD